MGPLSFPKFKTEDSLYSLAATNKNNFRSWDLVKYWGRYYVVCFVGSQFDTREGPWTEFEPAILFMHQQADEHER